MEFDKYKKFGAYHHIEHAQHTTYGVHADKVIDWINERKVLDVGAGDGLMVKLLIEKGVKCIGIDDNEIAVQLSKDMNIPVELMSAYKLSYPEETFDAVLMGDVIEHLEYPSEALYEVSKVLKPGGMLYITTPPRKTSGGLHDKYHFREYYPQELVAFVAPLGFELVGETEVKNVRIYAKFRKK